MTHLASRCVSMLRKNGFLRRGCAFVVAASGGMDSTVLCHLVAEFAPRWDLRLHFAYVHHGLRTEADAEARFVEQLAMELKAEFHLSRVDVRGALSQSGASLQDVARRLRYDALEAIRASVDAVAILTAHHADDQAETVLAHFLRGSGVRGLTGIKPVFGNVVRPLLATPRNDLLAEANSRGIAWMEDASNDTDVYTRNAIRHHVLPAIDQNVAPGVRSVLCDTSTLFSSLDAFLDAHTCRLLEQTVLERGADSVSLAVPAMKGYFEFERMLLLRSAVSSLRGNEASFDEVTTLLRLLVAPPGRHAVLRGDVTAIRERDALVLCRPAVRLEAMAVRIGETCIYDRARFSSAESAVAPPLTKSRLTEIVDLDHTGVMWRLRPWSAEDVFHPLGSDNVKRIRDFLADQGFPSRLRDRIPVLEGEHGIIWVCGVRLDQRAALTDQSERFATISYQMSKE